MCKVQTSALFLLVLVAGIISADAQTYTVLYYFGTSSSDGTAPYGSLVADNTGNLYGATFLGPVSDGSASTFGTIFKFAPPGTLTTLHTFTPSEGPFAPGVTLGADGNLYGVTGIGGTGGPSHACPNPEGISGCGTIFQLTPGGTYSVLYNFDQTHGSFPQNPLTLGSEGNFYGATSAGGAIFKITTQGNYSVLHYLDSTDGSDPGPLLQAIDGSLYGTTTAGGTNNTGTIFKITTAGQFTVVYNFGPTDGGPYSLVQGEDGNIYGAMALPYENVQCGPTLVCYCVAVCGAVFKITPQGSFSILYDFPAGSDISQGAEPYALVQGAGDNFFGLAGGGNNIPGCVGGVGTTGSYCDIIFQITPKGAYSVVYDFDHMHGDDGNPPIQGNDGNITGPPSWEQAMGLALAPVFSTPW
ncbi:MAG TPA: choice-of-anchor tandem repeat GloVer-containing protein [Terriglobales bacterium]|nr:choice-of-anchor tandem repeat GloVer-containing protein [Terriglobales bacterium]